MAAHYFNSSFYRSVQVYVPFSHVYPRQPGKNQAVTRSPEHRLAMDHLDEYWTIVAVGESNGIIRADLPYYFPDGAARV